MGKILEDVGAAMEIMPESSDKTRFIFTFYHRPKKQNGVAYEPAYQDGPEEESAESATIN